MRKEGTEKRRLSIRFYIFSTIGFLTALLICMLWLFHSILIDTVFRSIKDGDINRAANLISDNIDGDDVPTLISRVSKEYNLCVSVFDMSTHMPMYSNHFLPSCIICNLTDTRSLLDSWHKEASKNGNEYTIVLPREQFEYSEGDEDVDFDGDNCLICARIITDREGQDFLLVLNADIEPMNDAISAMRIVLLFVSLVLCLFAAAIAFILSKRLSKPIRAINARAKELEGGDYNVHFSENGPLEVSELAKTLNSTATELDRADKIQKELIANISHDLRTPLTMISGYSEFMRDFPSEISPENIQVIIDETARLNSLVNDLLYVSKLQSGTQVTDMKKINITSLIRDTVKRYDSLLEHKGYTISFECDRDVFVIADETRLLQVIYNLVNNAINYTGDDKQVLIRQDVLDELVRVSIIDTGEGISEENLPLVWDRYYKIDKVHKRAITGTGLGLSIVKNILLLHNSRFGVSSEVGKGSTFWFELKVVDGEADNFSEK